MVRVTTRTFGVLRSTMASLTLHGACPSIRAVAPWEAAWAAAIVVAGSAFGAFEVIERDYNAALNILDEGLRIIGLSSPEFTLADYPTVDDKTSKMSLKSSDRLKQEKNVFH